jgi:Fe2+ transport system protein FeoA
MNATPSQQAVDRSQEPVAKDPRPIGLTRLRVDSRARFHSARLDRADLDLLESLGLTDACRLRVCQTGDPWVVQVRTTRIGLAESIARAILVIPEGEP